MGWLAILRKGEGNFEKCSLEGGGSGASNFLYASSTRAGRGRFESILYCSQRGFFFLQSNLISHSSVFLGTTGFKLHSKKNRKGATGPK